MFIVAVLLFSGCKFLHTSEDSDSDVAGERRDALEGRRFDARYAVSTSVQKVLQSAHGCFDIFQVVCNSGIL